MAKTNELIIARNEELIKIYRFYSSSTNTKEEGEVQKNLIVSNKRIVIESNNASGFSREELPLASIDRIDTRFYYAKRGKFGLLILILGIVLNGLSLIEIIKTSFGTYNYLLNLIGTVLVVLGIIFFIIKKPKQAFKLTFYSYEEFHNLSSISGENFITKERKRTSEKTVKIKSKVTPAARVMINELNALLIDLKDFNFQVDYAKQMVLKKNLSPEEFEHHYHFLLNKIITLYK